MALLLCRERGCISVTRRHQEWSRDFDTPSWPKLSSYGYETGMSHINWRSYQPATQDMSLRRPDGERV